MERLVIEGGKRLVGTVAIGGAKNAAVAILPATILADSGICKIDNLPDIDDIYCMEHAMRGLGAVIERKEDRQVWIDNSNICSHVAISDEIRGMRASYYFLGVLLSKFGCAEVVLPGGCKIGNRPIDQHIKGFEAMGAKVHIENGIIKAYTENGLHGARIYLDVISVGATVNIMLAATKASGVTIIENAAKEPHIVDLAIFLNSMGANIKGAGTDTIKITGVTEMHGCNYSIVPDQIEAGTYMIAAAATRGDVMLTNVIPKHLEALTSKLMEMGVRIEEDADSIHVICDKRPQCVNIKTLPYPGFPTDLQQPMTTLLSLSEGRSVVHERIWEARFSFVKELRKIGADIKMEGNLILIEGSDEFAGAEVEATDLRAGAALVIAGLAANGVTTISAVNYIDRGYEHLEKKLSVLGASIQRIKG